MTFTPKVWVNQPSTTTPLDAAGLVDMEQRVYNGVLADAALRFTPGNLTTAYTLVLGGASSAQLRGTLSANNVMTITGLTDAAEVSLVLVQDSTGSRTFSILVNSITTVHAVNSQPLAVTAFKLFGLSTTDYALVPLGA